MDAHDDAAIKQRMDQRLGQLHWSLVDVAEATDESYRNVHRWIREDVKVPAHFVTRFAEVVPVSTRWLLTGEGASDPVGESAAKRALERIAHVLDSVRLSSSTGALAESVIQSSVNGILSFDREFRYTLWNPAMERISGVSSMAVLGKVAFHVFPFLEESGERACFEAALDGDSPVSRDRRYRIPESGRSGWYDAHYSPLRDGAGEIVGGLGIVQEVTDRKEALEKLRESEERHRRLLELNPEPTMVQVEGSIVYANRALERLLRCPEEGRLEGRPIESLIPEDERAWRLSLVREIEEGRRIGPLERTLLRWDGTPVEVEVRAVSIRYDGRGGTQAVIRPRNGSTAPGDPAPAPDRGGRG